MTIPTVEEPPDRDGSLRPFHRLAGAVLIQAIEDLFKVLEKMISEIANPKPRKNISIDLEPLEDFNFDQYLIKFEEIKFPIKHSQNDYFDPKFCLLWPTLRSQTQATREKGINILLHRL